MRSIERNSSPIIKKMPVIYVTGEFNREASEAVVGGDQEWPLMILLI